MQFKIIQISVYISVLCASAGAWAQPPARSQPPAVVDPNVISIQNVCAAALPRAGEGRQLQWSPDGRTIVYFKPVADGLGLDLELDAVDADGGNRKVLLTSKLINQAFLAKPGGGQGRPVLPPKASIGFQWNADSRKLLLFSNQLIFWLDTTTLKTTDLVASEDSISDVQLSPDGGSAAFVRNHNLWVVGTGGGAPRAITREGSATLLKGELDWLYPAGFGTKHGYVWSPDSSRIAYLEFDLKGVESYTPPLQLPVDPGMPAVSAPPTIDYPTPGTKIPQVRAFVIDHVNGKSKTLAVDTGKDANIYLPRFQWLPDGRQLAVERLDRAQSQLDLFLVDATTGSSRILLTEKDQYWINVSDILYFLKGTPQFIWSSERSGYRHLYLYDLEGKLVRPLTEGAWEVTSLDAVNEPAQKIYFTSTEVSSIERQGYVAGFDGVGEKRLTENDGTHRLTFSPDASAYVDDFSTATKPWSRSIYKLSDGANARFAPKVFALNDSPSISAASSALGRVNFVTVTTHDKVELRAMLIQPAGFSAGNKYPAVMYFGGGPGQQAAQNVWNGDVTMWQQLLAQHGYVVFAVDNRGTAGRGHLYEEYVHYKFAGIEMVDQHDGLDFLSALPYVDKDRIGVWGRGVGGMMTVNAMLHPRLGYKAGFAIAPIMDWFHYDTVFTERYLGSPVSNQDGYLSSTPLERAGALKNPLLVAEGTADLQVHPEQAMILQHALVDAHKYAEVALYPGQGHTIDGPDACVVSYQRATDFFGKNL